MSGVSRAAGVVRAAVAGVSLALFGVSAASALTLSETDAGEFSSDWSSPTVVGAGYSTVSGTGSANAYDIFHFTSLTSGAQDLTITFAAPPGIDSSYSAGGQVLWSLDAFRWGWDGIYVNPEVQVDASRTSQTLTLSLPDSFDGDLYLGLYFTYGASLAYQIVADVTGTDGSSGGSIPTAPTSPELPSGGGSAVSAVPLPPAMLMLGAGLAGLGFVARRRAAA